MLLCIMLSNTNQFRAEIPRYYHDVDTSYLMTSYTLLQQFYQDFLTAIMSRVVLVSVENVANIWMLKHILQVLSALSYSSSLPQLLVKQETTTLPPQPFKVWMSSVVLLPSKLTVQGKRIDYFSMHSQPRDYLVLHLIGMLSLKEMLMEWSEEATHILTLTISGDRLVGLCIYMVHKWLIFTRFSMLLTRRDSMWILQFCLLPTLFLILR